jgi:hypothetical protein
VTNGEQNVFIEFIINRNEDIMNKRIICGCAAILMTGLTVSVFTTAEPRDREYVAPIVAPKPMHEPRYVRAIVPAHTVAPECVADKALEAPIACLPG